jgi:DeoR/GlpR family transcriptional regulator of sugar metabolism
MLAQERRQKILELVETQGRVTVPELCQMFNVSEMTIRRDLRELDRDGFLRRVHGGAVSGRGRGFEPPLLARLAARKEQKQRIGRKAAELIFEGDTIALDVGTTTLEVARALETRHNLTVVTASLPIANELAGRADIRLILTGGIVRPGELSMVGHIAEQTFRDFFFDKVFLGVGAISFEAGLTEYNLEDAQVKKAMIKASRQVIVVCDSSKFGRTAFSFVSPLSAVDIIITDDELDKGFQSQLEKAGIKVITA